MAHVLSHPGPRWALTGGSALFLQGIHVPLKDIDIQTDAPSAYRVQSLLPVEALIPVTYSVSPPFRSHFGRRIPDGWLVEIMGDLQKLSPDGTWTDPPDLSLITRRVMCNGISVPVLDLAYEADAYDVLGRTERAALIRRHIQTGTTRAS